MSSAVPGRNVFLTRALEKILSEREIKRSQHMQLRKSCESTLSEIRAELKRSTTTKLQGLPGGFISADKHFLPFELACKSNVPRMISTSLDCIQKLMAYGQLRGMEKDHDNPDKQMIDRIIDTICGCFIGIQTDEGVQLQIIKALLTAMTCSTIEIHGVTVLQAVRCCYNIYLASKNIINQTTSKASLTQILSTLFQRMENEVVLQEAAKKKMASPLVISSQDISVAQTSVAEPRQDLDTSKVTPTKLHPPLKPGPSNLQSLPQPPSFSYHDEISGERVTSGGDTTAGSYGEDSDALVKVAKRLVAGAVATAVQKLIMDRHTSPDRSPCVNVSIPEVTPTSDPAAMNTMETLPAPNSESTPRDSQAKFSHILEKDCFMVFRSLCRLSMKGIPDIHDTKSHELRSKILSLELLLSLLQHSGPVFRTGDIFISAIKQYLCVTLSKNGVSSVPQVFELSLNIFLMLFNIFKIHLKMQIEVFFKEIFLSILESSSSSFQHKCLVLHALVRVCGDAQSVVDIYLNYDCDLSLQNIFEHLIRDLSKIAQGRQAIVLGATVQQEKVLRSKGLECLCSILKCMVEWSREYYIDPATTGLNAFYQSSSEGDDSEDIRAAFQPVETRSGRLGSVSARHQPNDTSDGDGVSLSSMDNPEQFQTQKQIKETMESGIQLFMSKPRKGIQFLQQKDLISEEPEGVAQVLYMDRRFNRTAIGDYLGEGNDYCKTVMYAYVDLIDFNGMEFVAALRHLLSRFRLPGEAQKIDRIMEKFAGRYVENNKHLDIFASADAAYVLAYSIIMLTTDLHSSQVKKKMTKSEYIKMNRGINDQKDLPREYLEAIYDEIASNEIMMNMPALQISSAVRQSIVSEKQRRQVYSQEMKQVAETAETLMENICLKSSTFTSATHVEHIRGMFKISWTSFLAAFSVALQDTEDQTVVHICLDAFRCAIRISCIFGLQLERSAFINSLAKFTMLTTSIGLAEMKRKNIETIRSLCAVAYTDGNYLEDSWIDVLQCISQLELAQLIGTGVKTRYLTHGGQQQSIKAPRVTSSIDLVLSGSDAKKMATIQEQVEETSSQSVVVAVDRIFTGSIRLDTYAIVDFVEALCAVSNQELCSPTHPRMFSLQKIVEICYYNMDRVRLEWSRMWEVIGGHFNTVGCLPSEEVSFFVVDSLRQLSMKFLEKGELANFRFQKDFLRPFEHIMKRNEAVTIRDMVVRCVAQMVNAKANQVRSGWKNIFAVFHLAASDHDSNIVEMAFQASDQIFKQHFSAAINSFQDAVKCLSEFSCNAEFPDTSMEAIRIISSCAKHISDNPEMFLFSEEDKSNPDTVWVRAWFPVMFELSTVISRCKLDVRTRGLTVMFEIMKIYGSKFETTWWQDLFKIVFRIFDNLKHSETELERTEWMTTTCNHALYALMDVFIQFFEVLSPVLLDDILGQLLWCVQQDNEQLARSGTNCLENLIILIGEQFLPETWNKVCSCAHNIYVASVPRQLLTWKIDESLMRKSFSMLSVASTRSSLTLDFSDITQTSPVVPDAPAIPNPINESTERRRTENVTAEELSASLQADMVQNGSQMPVIVVEPSIDHSNMEPSLTDGVAVAELVDNRELGANAGQGGIAESKENGSTVKVEDTNGEKLYESSYSQHHVETESHLEGSENQTETRLNETKQIFHPPPPDLNVILNGVEQAQAKNDRDSGMLPQNDKSSKFEKPTETRGKTRVKGGRKFGRKVSNKEKNRRGKMDGPDRGTDDNQSEMSYQPDTDLSRSKASKKSNVLSPEHALFNSMIIKCVVQLELIQAIDNILFFPNSTRQEDQAILEFSQQCIKMPPACSSERGMFKHLSTPQLFVLLNCLEESHMFSRVFNSNNEQRTLLMKAGFRGKTRPNLLRQETASVMCAMRLLYHMLADESRMEHDHELVQTHLLQLVNGALEYFLQLTSEVHREAWTQVLLLLFVRMLQLRSNHFKHHIRTHYMSLCHLLSLDLKNEVRALVRCIFSRIGHEFDVIASSVETQERASLEL